MKEIATMKIIFFILLFGAFYSPCHAQDTVSEWKYVSGRKDIDEILYRVETFEGNWAYAVKVYRDARDQGFQGDKKPYATRCIMLRFNKNHIVQLLKILPLKKQDGLVRFENNKVLVNTLKWDGKNWSYKLWLRKGGWETEVKEYRAVFLDKELMNLLKELNRVVAK